MDDTDLSNQLKVDESIKAFTSSLYFNASVGLGIFMGFCIVRHWSKKIYQPRTYLVTQDIQSPILPLGAFSWVTASFKVSDTELLEKVGLDAYMYLRFLRMSAVFFWGCSLLSLPVLMPLNMLGGINEDGLRSFNIGNIDEKWRLWFHLALTYIFCMAAILLLWREMREFIRRRHAYLMSEKHAKTPQSTTILVTGIPNGLSNEEALYSIFNRFPGGVAKIWLNSHPKNLLKLCKERDSVVEQLELAEYNYIRSAYGNDHKNGQEVKEPQRPLGKTSRIPGKGQKVDLVEFYTQQLCDLNQQIEKIQQSGSLESLNSAFIQFRTQFAAQSAVQTIIHPEPFKMAHIYSEISPLDVVWENMNLNTLTRKGRRFVIFIASTAMILLWTIPTIIVSSLASISDIVNRFSFLAFLQELPSEFIGFIQGILPPLLLAGLMALLPVLLTMMATYEGHVRHSSISLSVMSKYFFFLVTNVLLISTISGGILKTITELQTEGFKFDSVIKRFSEKLPEASTFFITYVLLRGFTGPPLELLQVRPLVLNFLYTQLLAKSPRQIWGVQGRLESVDYGILFPPQTLMFCIGTLYSTIAPPILPFVGFYFTMYYFVYRHQFLYVYHQTIETGGLAFPTAVKQAFTGIFISQITLFGIFMMKQAIFNDPAIPQLILILILVAITVIALRNMNEAFDPLVTFLPVALFSKNLHMDKDGVVTDGEEKEKSSPQNNEGEEVMYMENLSTQNLNQGKVYSPESEHHVIDKQDHGESNTGEYDPFSQGGTTNFRNRHVHQINRGSAADYHSNYSLSQYEYQPQQIPENGRPDFLTVNYGNSPASNSRPISYANRPTSNVYGRPTSSIDFTEYYRTEDYEAAPWTVSAQVNPELESLQDQAYCHPTSYDVQKPVWLPVDEKGLVQAEIDRLRSHGIAVATDGAVLNKDSAKAQVSGLIYAPGEEARYRLERGE
ncbi:hypothetical protein BGZ76_008105 [Entomortierella beljakovae]|nr:hypothetical protein BGZ76_008105 [Entomortierella beljakovae]